jgi:protein disulfide-isomerase-like protein
MVQRDPNHFINVQYCGPPIFIKNIPVFGLIDEENRFEIRLNIFGKVENFLMVIIAWLFIQTVICNVITANYKNFNEIVMKSNHVVMVEFFAPWCGHCKQLAPEYAKAASKLKGLAKLVAVDCDNSSNRELCSKYGVQGFPTLKVFSAGKKGMPSDYNSERTSKAIVDAITPMIPARFISKIGGTAKKSISIEEFKVKVSIIYL